MYWWLLFMNNPFEGRFHIESMLNDGLDNHLILSEDEYLKNVKSCSKTIHSRAYEMVFKK